MKRLFAAYKLVTPSSQTRLLRRLIVPRTIASPTAAFSSFQTANTIWTIRNQYGHDDDDKARHASSMRNKLSRCDGGVTSSSSSSSSSSLFFDPGMIHNARTKNGSAAVRPFLASTSIHHSVKSQQAKRRSVSYRRGHSTLLSHQEEDHHDDLDTLNMIGKPFLLADIGEGIKEVEVLEWFVKPHDPVQQFDKICRVQSDKATVEITSRYDGIVHSLSCAPGDMVQVGSALLYFVQEEQDKQQEQQQEKRDLSRTTPAIQPRLQDVLSMPLAASEHRVLASDEEEDADLDEEQVGGWSARDHHTHHQHKFEASPAVRKLAKEYGLDVKAIQGSGPNGRLLKMDVLTYLREQGRLHDLPNQTESASAHFLPAPPTISLVDTEEDRVLHPLKGYHRLMVATMTESLKIPHMGLTDEVRMDALLACRRQLQQMHPDRPWSILTLLLKACSLALLKHPLVNAVIVPDDVQGISHLHVLPNHDLGIAMDTPRGLVVPVVRNVQDQSLAQLDDHVSRLKAAAAASQLTVDDVGTPTLTLSNLGSTGVGTVLSPIIVPPQLVTGAMGRIQRLPRFVDASSVTVEAVHIMQMSWAGDHRVLDGATLAAFHKTFGRYVEQPLSMLAHLK